MGEQREEARKWPNQKEVTVQGNHFVQESAPHEIGKEISNFLKSLN